MCQLNLSSSWDLKHRILSKFKDYIDLSALLPVYVKDNYDFTKVDLIITTANKEITREPNCKTLLITPFLTQADQEKLENHIVKTQIKPSLQYLSAFYPGVFQEAFWHEKVVADDRFSVMKCWQGLHQPGLCFRKLSGRHPPAGIHPDFCLPAQHRADVFARAKYKDLPVHRYA